MHLKVSEALNWFACFCRSFVCVYHWRVSICSYLPEKSLKAAWILNLLRQIIAVSRDTEHSVVESDNLSGYSFE